MSEYPYISVCMPVYNAAPYLAAAIEGVLSQTYENYELIISDNCSTDDSAKIAQDYASRSSKIRFFQNNWNIEYSGNLQKVTSLASGDFLVAHAADDVALPVALETFVDAIRNSEFQPETLVLLSDYYIINQQNSLVSRITLAGEGFEMLTLAPDDHNIQLPPTRFLSGREVLLDRLPKLYTFGWPGSTLFARELFERVEGQYSNHWYNPDKFFIYKLLSLNPNLLWIREPVFYSRWHDTNQASLQRATKVLKYVVDQYAYTFELPGSFLADYGLSRDDLKQIFVERDCMEAALREMTVGSRLDGFRHLCFGLACYPQIAWKMPKTYLAWLTWLLGPLGKVIAKCVYHSGVWRNWQRR